MRGQNFPPVPYYHGNITEENFCFLLFFFFWLKLYKLNFSIPAQILQNKFGDGIKNKLNYYLSHVAQTVRRNDEINNLIRTDVTSVLQHAYS